MKRLIALRKHYRSFSRGALEFLHPPAPLPVSDLIVSESTYGARRHQSVAELTRLLQEVVRRTIDRGGKTVAARFVDLLGEARLCDVRHLQGCGDHLVGNEARVLIAGCHAAML